MPTYAFKTSKGWRVEAIAKTPKKAFLVAQENMHKIILKWAGLSDAVCCDAYYKAMEKKDEMYGQIIPEYITYRNGFARVDSWKTLK